MLKIAPCELCGRERMLFRIAGSDIFACTKCRRKEVDSTPAPPVDGLKFTNQHRTRRNAYPGERRGCLSREDKAHVCILAREAFVEIHGRAPADEPELSAWRRGEQRKACGFDSLTHCTQQHLPDLEAHFLNLKGESGKAFKKLMGREVAEVAVVRAVLRRNLREYGLDEGYAATICRSKNKCELDQANVKQIWDVVFQIRKNQQAKARRAAR